MHHLKPHFAAYPGRYVTADLESPLADLHFDVQQIPLADNSVDVILCNHLLEHVADDRRGGPARPPPPPPPAQGPPWCGPRAPPPPCPVRRSAGPPPPPRRRRCRLKSR